MPVENVITADVFHNRINLLLSAHNYHVGDKCIILKKNCTRDIIRRIFFVNSVDEYGIPTSLHQIKYYYHNANIVGITNIEKTSNKDIGIFYPKTDTFDDELSTYFKDGYELCIE